MQKAKCQMQNVNKKQSLSRLGFPAQQYKTNKGNKNDKRIKNIKRKR